MSTEYVYFDLGNVLFHFDHGLAVASLAELLKRSPDEINSEIFASGLQERYETGLINDEEFAASIRGSASVADVATGTILHHCSDIFRLNVPIVHLIGELKRAGVRIGILSNTCRAHWEFLDRGHFALLRELFDERVLSYEEQSMKPDRKIYEAAIRLANCPPESIFFTDDKPENVAGANAAGLDAELFENVPKLKRQLAERNLCAV